MRRLPRIAGDVQLLTDLPVERRHRRRGADVVERALVDVHEHRFELGVIRLQLAEDEVLRVVGPVAVGADPDLEQDGLALHHGQVAGGRERLDPAPGPDERERERELDLALVSGALAVHEALPQRGRLGLPHPRPEPLAYVIHRRGSDLVREPQPLDLLPGLVRTRADEERRRVARLGKRVEPGGRERRRLADHAVGRLRAERQLEPEALVVACRRDGCVERARERRPRILRVVAADQPHVVRPGGACGVLLRRLDRDQHRLALAREDARVVALHAPEVREVEDVVRSADDERIELRLRHERADAVELDVVARPGHHAILRRLRRMEPRRRRPPFKGYGVPESDEGMLPWSWAGERLEQARNYWVSTARPDGRPHAMPVWGIWLDDAFFFGSGSKSAKTRNLTANPAIVVHLESGDETVILEGLAEPVLDDALERRVDESTARSTTSRRTLPARPIRGSSSGRSGRTRGPSAAIPATPRSSTSTSRLDF